MSRPDITKRRVVLVPYNPEWAELFARERAAILKACGRLVNATHHIGSTAVPGLLSKSIIDILVVVGRPENGYSCIALLNQLGYEFRGENGIVGRFYFTKGNPRSHHLHLYPSDHPEVERHLRFRDYLRSHPDAAAAYEDLKLQLATLFAEDPDAYSTGKKEICAQIDRLAADLGHGKE